MSPLQGLMNQLESLPVALPQALTFRSFGAFIDFSNCFLDFIPGDKPLGYFHVVPDGTKRLYTAQLE